MNSNHLTQEQAKMLAASRGRISVYQSRERGEYFFTSGHLYHSWEEAKRYGFVAISSDFPQKVVPRPSLPDGMVDTLEKYIMIFLSDMKEVDPAEKYGWHNPVPKPLEGQSPITPIHWTRIRGRTTRARLIARVPVDPRLPTMYLSLGQVRQKNDGRWEVTCFNVKDFRPGNWKPSFQQRVVSTMEEATKLLEDQWVMEQAAKEITEAQQ